MTRILILFLVSTFGIFQNLLAQEQINLVGDSAHVPFIFGVASGDPAEESVLLWTKINLNHFPDSMATVDWEIAVDSHFTILVSSGSTQTDSSKSFTILVEPNNLSAGSTYYYRFIDSEGRYSAVGRTKTSPISSSHLRFGIASCSSLFSGYFNAYARMAARADLQAIIHLGDYIYDFVDADEEVRIPDPYPVDPTNLAEWRARHELYLLDPDLREARRLHPWVVMWDNHDVDMSRGDGQASIQAFREFVPSRLQQQNRPDINYRRVSFGNLVDLIMLDILIHRDRSAANDSLWTILGLDQRQWLNDQILSSTASWRIFGNQKIAGNWDLSNIPGGDQLGNSGWSDFFTERNLILSLLDQNKPTNNIFVTGDAHLSLAMDLPYDPFDENEYDPETGIGSKAVEFLPTSISRGNLDEMGLGGAHDIAVQVSMGLNEHHLYSEFIQHGYGILDVKPDSVVAEIWYAEILEQTVEEQFGIGLVILDGTSHWQRNLRTESIDNQSFGTGVRHVDNDSQFKISPNPTNGKFEIHTILKTGQIYELNVLDLSGRLKQRFQFMGGTEMPSFDISTIARGVYLLEFVSDQATETVRLVKN